MLCASLLSEGAVVMNKRQVDLLTNLCASTTHIAVKNFAVKYHVSKKTIYKDLDVIDDYLINTKLTLERKQRVGIKVIGTNQAKQQLLIDISNKREEIFLKNMSPIQRRIAMVKDLILDGKKQTLKNLSEKWIVSKTSILKDVEVVNSILKNDSNKLVSDGNMLYFNGNKLTAQNAVTTFIVSITYDKNETNDEMLAQFFSLQLIQSVNDVFFILVKRWFSDLPTYYLFALRVIVMAQIYILNKYGETCSKNDKEESYEDEDTKKIAEQIFKMVSERFSFNYNVKDIKLLANNLSAYRIGIHSPLCTADWENVIDILLERMESIQKMNFLGWSQLKKQLLYHIPAMVLRLQQDMAVRNPLLNDVKKQYPALFGMTWYALSFLENKFHISLNDDEVSFITIYFHVALNRNIVCNNVLIVFGQYDQLHGYVESQIEQLLPTNVRFITTTIENLNNVSLNSIDLLIEVAQLPIVVKVPQVMISPLIDEYDQSNILKAYAEHVILQGNKSIQPHFPTLKKIINRHLIFWQEKVKDKREALNFLVDQLEKNKVVQDSFRESIFRREKHGSTELEGGAALPHAAPETVLQLSIAILILRKPIWWNTEKVHIVLIACVPNEEIKIYRELILDVYRLVKNKQRVQFITQMQSTQSLIKMVND